MSSDAPPTAASADEALLASNYSIPILWLSMFGIDDVTMWRSTLEPEDYAGLFAPTTECLARSRTRVARWSATWPTVFADIGRMWIAFLESIDTPFLGVWTEEISGMSGHEEFVGELEGYLGGLDDSGSEGFVAALRQSYFDVLPGSPIEVGATDDLGVIAAGYEWDLVPPWKASPKS
jgi:hypothetical protein